MTLLYGFLKKLKEGQRTKPMQTFRFQNAMKVEMRVDLDFDFLVCQIPPQLPTKSHLGYYGLIGKNKMV